MAIARICSKIKAKPVAGFRSWLVIWNGLTIAKFEKYSPAKTFAKRWNSMFAWLGQSDTVFVVDFSNAVSQMLTIAGAGDGRYRPPLTLS